MSGVPPDELERQYRVLRQTLSMHAALRDQYARRAKIAEIMLILCSVVFVATTFAADDVFLTFGVAPRAGRIALGVASVLCQG